MHYDGFVRQTLWRKVRRVDAAGPGTRVSLRQGARRNPAGDLPVMLAGIAHSVRLACSFAFVLSLGACATVDPHWRPGVTSDVLDGTVARFRIARDSAAVMGTSSGWQGERPLLITGKADSVRIPRGARIEVRLPEKRRHPIAGAFVGWALGIGVTYARCASLKYCGESASPVPLFGFAIGWWAGSTIKTDWWTEVRWDSTRHQSPPLDGARRHH